MEVVLSKRLVSGKSVSRPCGAPTWGTHRRCRPHTASGPRGGAVKMNTAQDLANPAVVLLGLAVLDSINPSALLVTLYLLRQPSPSRTVPAYVAGVFGAYLTIGGLLVLGFAALLTRCADELQSPCAYAALGLLGGAVILCSFMPARRARAEVVERVAVAATIAGLFAVGDAV